MRETPENNKIVCAYMRIYRHGLNLQRRNFALYNNARHRRNKLLL